MSRHLHRFFISNPEPGLQIYGLAMRDKHATILPLENLQRPRKTGFGLPPDLQQKACRRVAQFALLMTGIMAVVFLISRPVWQDFTPDSDIFIVRVTQGIIVVLSAALFLVARSKRISPSVILHLGLIYEFLFCLTYSVGYNWFTGSAYGIFAAINLSTIVIAVYPMIVPSPPLKTLITALASAATAPLGVYVVSSMELAKSHPADYLGISIYPAACVVLAMLGSRIIYGLNRDVAAARELGSYRLNKLLGKGGMGEVWRAVHRLLARPAAIKLILPRVLGTEESSAGGNVVQRFEREAKATASLQSPHTVALYDFGRTEEGTFYYVMELLDGLDLESLVNRFGPMPAERVVAVLKQACRSLAEAHDAGLVHRDVKPANIMVCRYGREFDFVKVLDFGLVALQAQHKTDDPKLTADGIAGGTPAYMPPEIAEGKPVDGRTDLYALGCVAYWMLTGHTVFEGETPMGVILSHVSEPPPPMARRSEVEIPKELEEIVMACLEKSPDRRPLNADELLARLESIPLASPWNDRRARSWWESHRPETAARTVSED